MNKTCRICKGIGWVCESHPRKAWSDRLGCTCGAGMMCKCQRTNGKAEGIEEPDVSIKYGDFEDASLKALGGLLRAAHALAFLLRRGSPRA